MATDLITGSLEANRFEGVAGISPTNIYYASVSEVKSIPDFGNINDATITDFDTASTITGNIEMETDKVFKKIEILPDTGGLSDEGVGQKGAMSVKTSLSVTLPGVEENALGFLRDVRNAALIVLVQQKNGKVRLIGSKTSPCYLTTASTNTGVAAEDVVGSELVFEANAPYAAPIYEGAIPLTTATP